MPNEQSNIKERTRYSVRYPDMYNVIMHNDDFTSMEFVVKVLRVVFLKELLTAQQLMLTVHKKGNAIVGTYTLDIATSKSQRAMQMARQENYPFKLTVEPVELPF